MIGGGDAEQFLPRNAACDDLLIDQPCRNGRRGERNQRPSAARSHERSNDTGNNAAWIRRCERHACAREERRSQNESEGGDEDQYKSIAEWRIQNSLLTVHACPPAISQNIFILSQRIEFHK